jgi:4-aminobutyrate aminotransferase/(S)-3-amino-2-methylpropionate transaminase
MDAVHPGGLGGTFGGNPVACEAALGAIATIEELDLVSAARRIGSVMLPRLRAIQKRSDVVGDVRGRGAMTAIELVMSRNDKTPNPDAATEIARRCHSEGLLVLTAGTYGNVLRFLPPLVMPEHLLDEGLSILESAIASL